MRDDRDIVVAALARTPFGKYEGALASIDGPSLGAMAIDETLRRAKIQGSAIDAVYAGVGLIGCGVLTPARQAVLQSSLPRETPSASIDRACCSGMTALGVGFKDLRLGEASMVLCGGFESLSRAPMLLPRQRDRRIGAITLSDPLIFGGAAVDKPIAAYSGDEALRHDIDREQQDRWALQSHERYHAAQSRGYFDFERFAVQVDGKSFAADESPRAGSTLEKLASLKTVHGSATITAGNAPGLNDGAAFLLLCTRAAAREHGLEPMARLVDYVQVCGGPTSGTSTPAVAISRIAERHGLPADRWDLVEINEAYAATPLVSTLVLAGGDKACAEALRARTNVHGGAVALGHPLGASGARITMTLVNGLRARGGGLGVAAICGGFGQGDAVMVEVE